MLQNQEGDRIKKTKIVSVRWIPDNFDSDWDGVPNYRDCQPFNPNKQGLFHTDAITIDTVEPKKHINI